MGGDKITCSTCEYEKGSRCVKKNVKIKVNKKRRCNLYKQDNEKLMTLAEKALSVLKPESTMRPDWYWDKKRAKEIRRQIKTRQNAVISNDPKHPLTGDLSRFIKSTAVD